MKPLAVLLCLVLTGCATMKGGPRKVAETSCTFAFLLGIPAAGALLGAALCSFGVEEIEDDSDV